MQRVALITGITGQDGSYLTEFLLKKDYIVHGIIRRASSFNTNRIDRLHDNPNLILHYGDLTDGGCISKIVLDVRPDEIYNLGAMSHPKISFDQPIFTVDTNGIGALRVYEAARDLSKSKLVKVYQASSSAMFGSTPPPQNETTTFHPTSPYGCAKAYAYWQAINYREAYGLFIANGIAFNHESERRGETFVTRKITKAAGRIVMGLQKELLLGNLDTKRDWGYAGDYVEAMWLMLQQDKPDDFVLATGETHTVREVLDVVFGHPDINRDWTKYVKKEARYVRAIDSDVLCGDPSKAKRVLGWEPKVKFKELMTTMTEADIIVASREVLARHHISQITI
jgi:GDPmannose 4,6-dehydratase